MNIKSTFALMRIKAIFQDLEETLEELDYAVERVETQKKNVDSKIDELVDERKHLEVASRRTQHLRNKLSELFGD